MIYIGLQTASGDFNARRLTLGEICFAGVYTYTMQEFHNVLALLKNPKLSDYRWLTTTKHLADGDAYFQRLTAGSITAANIILMP